MKPVYLYHATITPADGRPPIELDVGWRGVDQARFALCDRFRVSPAEVKLRAERDEHGQPREMLVETLRDEQGEQCWSDNNAGTARCPEIARPGFHTCKIHTLFDAPAPFGTPDYERWIDAEMAETAPKPKKRRTATRTRKTAAKPAAARSAPRRKRNAAGE